jgi:hypothetical protein
MRSLESLIYDILTENKIKEDIGVGGSDKPIGVQGGFSGSFSSRHPNSSIAKKRKTAQQQNAAPIASFESGKNTKNPVPNQGDATSIGDLSARGASESGKYKSIKTKLKEIREQAEKKQNNVTQLPDIKSPFPAISDETWKSLNEPNPDYLPKLKPFKDAGKDIYNYSLGKAKNIYHDIMGNSSKKDQSRIEPLEPDDKTEILGSPIIPGPTAGMLGKILKQTLPNSPKLLPPPLKQLPPPEVAPPASVIPKTGKSPETMAPEVAKPSDGTAMPKPQTEPQLTPQLKPEVKPQESPGVTTRTKTEMPQVEMKPETPQNVPATIKPQIKPEVKTEPAPTKLEPQPGNPPENTRQGEQIPSPAETQTKTMPVPVPSTQTDTKEKTGIPVPPITTPPNGGGGGGGPILKGAAGAGAGGLLGGLLASTLLGAHQRPTVNPAGFIHPARSEISGFSFTPLGMASGAAQSSPGADKSHILARLKTLLPASDQANKAGEDRGVTEEINNNEGFSMSNLDKKRREVEYLDRKEKIKKRFSSRSNLGRLSAIQTRIIDENARNDIIREAISEAIKQRKFKKSEKMTVGSEKTPVDLHPVLKAPPENQPGRAN